MNERCHIEDLFPADEAAIARVAALLSAAFPDDDWADPVAALAEVRESLAPERISRVARDQTGAVIGWIGGLPRYDGRVWELHPLVVAADHRRQGVGRALVADLEDQVRRRGALTLWLGTDDTDGRTSLSGQDLYADLLEQLRCIHNLADHPFSFYLRLGFAIVGVVPDANGFGRPDILMAKRVAPLP